ncbi:hypothetical protein JCM30566_15600 [Marinitoga arctica]
MRYYYPGYNTFGGLFGFGWIGMIIIGIVLFLLIYIIINSFFKKKKENYIQENTKRNKALEILNERFVNGEIDEEEYLRKKNLLGGE